MHCKVLSVSRQCQDHDFHGARSKMRRVYRQLRFHEALERIHEVQAMNDVAIRRAILKGPPTNFLRGSWAALATLACLKFCFLD